MHVQGHHYGEVLAEKVFEMLDEYDICDKLFCITTDGAGNNNTMSKELSRLLKEEKDIDWNHEEMHLHCMNHIINLAVQKFLKSIKGLAPKDELDVLTDDANMDDEEEPCPEGFALAMWKIRTITKVPSEVNFISFPMSFIRYMFVNSLIVRK